jgi:hypothetical protein
MKEEIDLWLITIKAMVGIFAIVITYLIKINKNLFTNDKVIIGKYRDFKILHTEYLSNKINGYFALQNYMKTRLSRKEIDFIFKSTDAYSIISLIKSSAGNYSFKGNYFEAKVSKLKHILSFIGYWVSSLILIPMITFSVELINTFGIKQYVFLLVIFASIFMPILLNSIWAITEITSSKKLEEITKGKIKIKKNSETDN